MKLQQTKYSGQRWQVIFAQNISFMKHLICYDVLKEIAPNKKQQTKSFKRNKCIKYGKNQVKHVKIIN